MQSLARKASRGQVPDGTESVPFRTPETAPPNLSGSTGEALPCLSGYNSIEIGEIREQKSSATPNSREYQKIWALRKNLAKFVKDYGVERMCFVTLTFKHSVKDWREASRRYNSFRSNYLAEVFEKVLAVIPEPHGNGCWHYHLVAVAKGDIRTGFDWESFLSACEIQENAFKQGKRFNQMTKEDKEKHRTLTKKYSASASSELKSIWSAVREGARACGFGRCETLPVKSEAEQLANYVGKYLAKGFETYGPETKGMQRVRYARGVDRAVKGQVAWAEGRSRRWRRCLGAWARAQGIKEDDFGAMAEKFGSCWAHTYRDTILEQGSRLWFREHTDKTRLENNRQRLGLKLPAGLALNNAKAGDGSSPGSNQKQVEIQYEDKIRNTNGGGSRGAPYMVEESETRGRRSPHHQWRDHGLP